MATTITPQILSGSTNGQSISITATASPGTVLHTADATALDELWLYADTTTTSNTEITVEIGSTTFTKTIPGNGQVNTDGRVNILDGHRVTGSIVIAAFISTGASAELNVSGNVNRITT